MSSLVPRHRDTHSAGPQMSPRTLLIILSAKAGLTSAALASAQNWRCSPCSRCQVPLPFKRLLATTTRTVDVTALDRIVCLVLGHGQKHMSAIDSA